MWKYPPTPYIFYNWLVKMDFDKKSENLQTKLFDVELNQLQ